MKRACLFPLLLLVVAPVAAEEEEFGLLELFNYYEYTPEYTGRLASAGQPTREQYPAIAEAGVEAVINLAPVTDPGALPDEGEIAAGLGLEYVHIPVDWEAPSSADIKTFFDAMARFKGKRILVHCYANARASAFVYLWRVLAAGDPRDHALNTMVGIWETNEGYELRKVEHWRSFIAATEASPPAGS